MKKVNSMSKNTKLALGVVVIVIIGALLAFGAGKKKTPVSEIPNTNLPESSVENSSKPNKSSRSSTTSAIVTTVDTRSYSELISAYKGRTLQFDSACQVHMSKQGYKVGSEVLLDNRGSSPAIIKFASSVYNLGAYGYKVVTLSSLGEYTVDCNDRENVATLTIQK